MIQPPFVPDDASRAQISAANPDASTWLSANAGSGKTRVLTDRVARLLLRQVSPQRILCLTYTKAAASEMQNRLFMRLGSWAMMPEEELRTTLQELGLSASETGTDELRAARALFAKAIETPGGLKIQTIHSFCASLLRRFPLEAGVTPAFREIDDRAAKHLRQEVLDTLAVEEPEALTQFARHFGGIELEQILTEITSKREHFAKPLDQDALRRSLEVPASAEPGDELKTVFLGGEEPLIRAVVGVLEGGTSNDQKLAAKLRSCFGLSPSSEFLRALEAAVMTKSGTLTKIVATKASCTAMGPHLEAYVALRERVAQGRALRLGLAALGRSLALHHFARAYLARLDRAKQSRGWLDFDDLILRSRDLLSQSAMASWVLFRLDGGVDHILVDEAQDTSPPQWDVVRLLTEEFTAGAGARSDTPRTLFVVGDQKQSIYSFQGADPAAFETMRAHFDTALQQIGTRLHREELTYSFRSSRAILDLVDASFPEERRAGMGDALTHRAFKSDLPGRVELWPWEAKHEGGQSAFDKQWFDPVDVLGEDHHFTRLARKLAEYVQDRIAHGQITQTGPDGPVTRRMEPQDFLILVERRKDAFQAIIRAFKSAGLPLAGPDRLKINAELAVKDVTALLKFLATPEDDLSLAAFLRSPMAGLSEADLFDLAHDRGPRFLRQSLQKQKDRFPEVFEMIQDLRKQADFFRPYELIERILIHHSGRMKLKARLGDEVEDGLRALLDQALTYEATDIPSLTGFLHWLESDDFEIKRQSDNTGNQIRIMTVHGAKGLEAPIVILPDTGVRRGTDRDAMLTVDGQIHWKPRADAQPSAMAEALEGPKQAAREERMRLLYVALTRAESQLLICGAGDEPKPDSDAWYSLIKDGMEACGAEAHDGSLTLLHGSWPSDLGERAGSRPIEQAPPLPSWCTGAVPPPLPAPLTIAPSKLEGEKILPGPGSGLSEDQAKQRGTAIHLLLEHLDPQRPADWQRTVETVLGEDTFGAFDVARKLLEDPGLAALFDPDALAEVNVSAYLPELGAPVLGSIDRLLVSETRITAVDFKSNTVVPSTPADTPLGLLRQMAAYDAALQQIYPNHEIATAILWTQTGRLMQLPHEIVRPTLTQPHRS